MPIYTKRLRVLLVVLALGLVTACNIPTSPETPEPGGVVDAPTEKATAQPTAESTDPSTDPEPSEPVASSGAVSRLEDVKLASIQIEAQGTFVDPEVGLQMNTAGRGSGFIIDPSGIAVTNNHVVTGAAFQGLRGREHTAQCQNPRRL